MIITYDNCGRMAFDPSYVVNGRTTIKRRQLWSEINYRWSQILLLLSPSRAKYIMLAVISVLMLVAWSPPCFKGRTLTIWLDAPKAYHHHWTRAQRRRIFHLFLFGECRGCSYDARVAVAHVVLNRSAQWHLSVEQVLTAYKQFSCFNPWDKNITVLKNVDKLKKNSPDQITWIQTRGITLEAFNGSLGRDPTHGATFYATTRMGKPYWAKRVIDKKGKIIHEGMIVTAVIGDHTFYKPRPKSHHV